ncbi:MAG TPA: hypothetical protein DCX52_05620 [Massilia sp.]|nr:hypothetical protein [Massilia sp.]
MSASGRKRTLQYDQERRLVCRTTDVLAQSRIR